jgi:hypothetical protein
MAASLSGGIVQIAGLAETFRPAASPRPLDITGCNQKVPINDGNFASHVAAGERRIEFSVIEDAKYTGPTMPGVPFPETVLAGTLPAVFNTESKCTVTVTRDGPNQFTFELMYAVTKAAPPLARITGTQWRADAVEITWTGGPPIAKAQWVYATLPQPDMTFSPPGTRTDWPKVKYTVTDAAVTPRPANETGSFTATLPRPEGMVAGWVNLIDDRDLAVSSELLAPMQ